MNLTDLLQEIPYKWKIQSFNKDGDKASCVAYVDARDVMDLLDKVVGAENWSDDYKIVGDRLMAGVGIKCGDSWIWKWDTGTESDYEKEKGLVSDAFKRAAVKWGVGRFLYSLEIQWVKVKDKAPIDDEGKRIWNLTEYIERTKKDFSNAKASNYKVLRIRSLAEELGRQEKLQTTLAEKFEGKSLEDLTSYEADTIIKALLKLKDSQNEVNPE